MAMMKYQTALGDVFVSQEVLETVVGMAVNDCFGVAAMAAKDTVDSIVALLRKSRLDKGVRVIPAGDESLSIELHIVVVYGLNIAAVAESISEKVKFAVEEATGLGVRDVIVCVDDMKV